MAKAGLQFQPKDEWYTPKAIVDYFGPFDYDPATTDAQAHRLGIPNYDTVETDGLSADWTRFNRIWCNPPFTRKFEFLEKAIRSGKRTLFLIPIDSLPTKSFQSALGGGHYKIYLPNGRIKFEDGTERSTSPAFGSVIIELGDHIKTNEVVPIDLAQIIGK